MTQDYMNALSRLRRQFGDAATVELLAAAHAGAATWTAPATASNRLARLHELSAALHAGAPAAFARLRAEGDSYARRQGRGPTRTALEDLEALVASGPALAAVLDEAIADLAWLRDAIGAAPGAAA